MTDGVNNNSYVSNDRDSSGVGMISSPEPASFGGNQEKAPLVSNDQVILDKDWYDSEEKVPIKFDFKKLMSFAGPGLLMSIAYLDPGNIAGDLDAGVAGKYQLIWTLFWSTLLGWYY